MGCGPHWARQASSGMASLQIIVNGISVGAVYAMFAVGFWVIYSVTRTFHFAHITVLTYTAYAYYSALSLFRLPVVAAVLVAAATAVVLGVLIERVVYQPIRAGNGSDMTVFIASFAVVIIGKAVLALFFGEESHGVTGAAPGPFINEGGIAITIYDIEAVSLCALMVAALVVLLTFTRRGHLLRAVQGNPSLAPFFGISVERVYLLSFALGSLLLVPALMVLVSRNGVSPDLGTTPVLVAMIAVIVGGTQSLLGGVLAGIGLGLAENLTLIWLPAQWQSAVVFAVLLLVMLVRPRGLRAAAQRATG
jgi:branched-chain amino acid transport system permease protein